MNSPLILCMAVMITVNSQKNGGLIAPIMGSTEVSKLSLSDFQISDKGRVKHLRIAMLRLKLKRKNTTTSVLICSTANNVRIYRAVRLKGVRYFTPCVLQKKRYVLQYA